MGTIKRAVNLAKAIFNRKKEKSVYVGRKERRKIDNKESQSGRRLADPARSGFKFKTLHAQGGGRNGAAGSDAVIFSPQRKKMKGYERDHATGKKRVA